MKYIYALLAGIISAVFAAYFSAIIIVVTNIYLMGHNITWQAKSLKSKQVKPNKWLII